MSDDHVRRRLILKEANSPGILANCELIVKLWTHRRDCDQTDQNNSDRLVALYRAVPKHDNKYNDQLNSRCYEVDPVECEHQTDEREDRQGYKHKPPLEH